MNIYFEVLGIWYWSWSRETHNKLQNSWCEFRGVCRQVGMTGPCSMSWSGVRDICRWNSLCRGSKKSAWHVHKFCPDIHGLATTPSVLYLFLLIFFPPFPFSVQSSEIISISCHKSRNHWNIFMGNLPTQQNILTSNEDQWAVSVQTQEALEWAPGMLGLKDKIHSTFTLLGSCCSSISSMFSLL